MLQPTLLILAAGMGSRYGSLKQVDRFGPAGETIVEYSLFDALRAGFGDIVFVIRREFLDDFRNIILKRVMHKAHIRFAFQELDLLPHGFSLPPDRVKPWGTGHAVLSASGLIQTPFAVINADDFYGAESYKIIYDFLSKRSSANKEEYCLVDYQLSNTLSESGAVSRGVCRIDEDDYLVEITEHKKIGRSGPLITGTTDGTDQVTFTGNERVSMNLAGFTPSFFKVLENRFNDFLKTKGHDNSAEFYLPAAMNDAIHSGIARVKVLSTPEKWFGVTYREDREMVMNSLNKLVENGTYPRDLWNGRGE
jgi:NDP-sugar pyrophosphorylase family protein